jgi:type IV secretory pathway VirB4 component
MMPLARIFKDYDEAGALNSVVNLYGFADDHVFLTKSGDLGVVLALEGVDYECLDPDQREAVTRRFEVALRVLDESMRLSQYVLKRNRVAVPHTPSTDPVVDTLLERRRRWLEDKGADLYTLQLYAVVLAESRADTHTWASRIQSFLAAPFRTVREWLSTRHTVVRLDDEIERLRRRLLHKVDAFVAQLQDTVKPRVLTKDEAFRFFRQLLNYDPAKADAIRLREDTFLDYHAGDSTLECHRSHLRLDDYHVRVLTLKEPPAQTFPHLFQALYEIPSNLILMTDWRREEQAAIRKVIHAMRRHFHNARISLTSYLGETPTAPSDLLVDDSAAAVVKDLGACLTEMTLHGRYAGHYTMTVVLYDTDPAALDRSVAACTKAFAVHDAQVTDERINLLNAWLAILPGNSAYNLRSMYLLNTNYADLACLFSQSAGAATNPHLARESLAVLETTQATLYHVNLHVDDVGHTLVLGATGSGKSGATLRLGLERRDVRINPFCLPPTPANLHFLFGFVKVLIQSGGQYTLTVADDRDLYEQVEALYTVDPDQRRLFTLTTILRKPLAQPLQRWVQGGPYASLFDHVEDTVTVSRFQYVDFEGLDGYPQLLEPLLFYLLHRADAAMTDPSLAGTLKVFVLDEAWRFLRDPTIRQYVTEAWKTWRKKDACVLLATQSSEDLARSELLRVAIESCPTKCFLANPHIDRAVYQELFHLNETEAELIERLVPRQQLLLKRPDHAKVLNLTVDPESARLYSLAPSWA